MTENNSSELSKESTAEEQFQGVLGVKLDEQLEELEEEDVEDSAQSQKKLLIPKKIERDDNGTVSDDAPLPWKQLLLVFFMYVVDVFSFTTLMPYVVSLVKDMNLVPDGDIRKVGNYASFIGSSYYAAQFASAFFWGYISDIYGRRIVLLIGIFGGCVTSLLFGFSKSLFWAIGTRTLFGLLNGNLGAYKVYISEITPKKHHARVFSFISLSFSIGTVFGPIVGGFMANPVEQYPFLFYNDKAYIIRILNYYPFLLPNLLVSFIQFVSFSIGYRYLTESNQDVLNRSEKARSKNNKKRKFTLMDDKTDLEEMLSGEEITQQATYSRGNHFVQSKKSYSLFDLHFELPITGFPLIVSSLYAIIGFNNIVFAECSPLFLVLTKELGGLNFRQKQIGITNSITGLMMVLFQIFLCHRIMNKLGLLHCLRYCSLLLVFVVPMYPLLNYFTSYPTFLWILLTAFNFIRFSAIQTSFACSNVMLNNSVLPKDRGKLNGFAQSLVALARALAPLLGIVFALTLRINFFPFDIYFIYLLMSFMHMLSVFLTTYLTEEINEPKKIECCDF